MADFEKLYLIYVSSTGELYGWTQNKELAKKFVDMRKSGYFVRKTKKIDTADTIAQFGLGRFRSFYRDQQIFMNVLGGKDDTINFPTTYEENYKVQKICDSVFGDIIEVSRTICAFPLAERFREDIETMSFYASYNGGKNIYCDTFAIFMRLYGKTII